VNNRQEIERAADFHGAGVSGRARS